LEREGIALAIVAGAPKGVFRSACCDVRVIVWTGLLNDVFRRELLRVLNRGESVNSLKRATCMGRGASHQTQRPDEMRAVADVRRGQQLARRVPLPGRAIIENIRLSAMATKAMTGPREAGNLCSDSTIPGDLHGLHDHRYCCGNCGLETGICPYCCGPISARAVSHDGRTQRRLGRLFDSIAGHREDWFAARVCDFS
jgi:hypothetical protein